MKTRRKSTGTVVKKVTKRKRETIAGQEAPNPKAKKDLTLKESLLRLRMKLQMFLQQKESYTQSDFDTANIHLLETEKISMNADLFRVYFLMTIGN